MSQQPSQSPLTVINNFFSRTPEPVVKQPATLQKRESESTLGAQERAEGEVVRLEKKIAQQQKQLDVLYRQITTGPGRSPSLEAQYRSLESQIKTNRQLCDNLRTQCNQVDNAKTIGRTSQLLDDLATEKEKALKGVTLASVERTTVKSRIADRNMDKLFGRLTGTQHLDEDEEDEANDDLYERLMRDQQQEKPLVQNEVIPTRMTNNNSNNSNTAYVKGSNRAIDSILNY